MIRPTHIIVITGKSIYIYPTIGAAPQTQPLPEKLIKNQEVVQPAQIITALSEFLKKLEVTKMTLLLLGDDMIYQRTFTPAIPEESDPRVEAFLDEVPFEPKKIAFRILTGQGKSVIIAANREIPETIIQAITRAGGSCIGTVPLIAYNQPFHTPLLVQEQQTIANDTRIMQFAEILAPKQASWFGGVLGMLKRPL